MIYELILCRHVIFVNSFIVSLHNVLSILSFLTEFLVKIMNDAAGFDDTEVDINICEIHSELKECLYAIELLQIWSNTVYSRFFPWLFCSK